MSHESFGNDVGKLRDARPVDSFANVVSRRLLVNQWKPPSKSQNLWDQAITALGAEKPANQSIEGFTSGSKPEEIIAVVREKLEQCKKKKLKFKKKDGTEVTISDELDKIAGHINRFKEIVDEVVQYDPGKHIRVKTFKRFAEYTGGHLALPWAMIRILLQVTVNNAQAYGSLISGLECVSRIVVRYADIERTYIRGTSTLQSDLASSLLMLYTTALRYLIAADEYFGQGRAKRYLKALAPKVQSGPSELLDRVKDAEEEVQKVFTLVEAEDLRNRILADRYATSGLRDVSVIAEQTISQQRIRLVAWLGAVFTVDTYQNAIETRLAHTGNWIFERTPFQQWSAPKKVLPASSKLLWIHGGPGFGRTILCATILESLGLDKTRKLASYFCSSEHEERRDPLAILRSWIAQLIQSNDKALRVTLELYKVNMTQPPTAAELWKILRLIISLLPSTLVIDGFDECSAMSSASKYNTRNGKSQFLHSLVHRMRGTDVRVLLVSRDHEDIKSVLNELAMSPDPSLLEIPIGQQDTERDVLLCSRHIINTKLADRTDGLREEIATDAARKSAGMFLFLDLLGQEINPGDTTRSLRKIVSEMPTGLENVYKRELKRILDLKGYRREQALAVLRWILFAVRPLSVRELAEALILTSDETEPFYPFDALPKTWGARYVDEDYVNDNITKYCGSLVELRKSSADDSLELETVHFVHASVRDYLLTPQRDGGTLDFGLQDEFTENDHLARLCLRYLCYDIFNEADDFKIKRRIRRFPFLFYATKSWYNHARLRKSLSRNLEPDIEKLFDPNTKNWVLWSDVFEGQLVPVDKDNESLESTQPGEPIPEPSSAHNEWDDPGYADYSEENASIGDSQRNGESCSEKDGEPCSEKDGESMQQERNGQSDLGGHVSGPNPIYYASLLGLTNLVKSLRAQGLDCNTAGGKFGFPLQAAIEGGYHDTVFYLLDVGVDVNRSGGYYGSALGAAAAQGAKSVVERLLSMGARADATDNEGANPLHFACQAGEVEIADLLLRHNNSLIKTQTRLGVSAFCFAVCSGKLELVTLLRRFGADVDDKDDEAYPVLAIAVACGYQEITLDLVRHRAKIDARTAEGMTSLQLAAQRGDEKIVRLLVACHAELNTIDNSKWSVMHYACSGGSAAIVKLLAEKGASVDLAASYGFKPLHVAAELPNLEIVRILLHHDAGIDDTCWSYQTPLMHAIIERQFEVAKLLIERGANTSMVGVTGDIALDYALYSGHQDTIRLLLENGGFHDFGAEFNAKVDPSLYAETLSLPLAAYSSIVDNNEKAFLARLEECNFSNTSLTVLNSALLISVALKSITLVRYFLDRGSDPSCRTLHRRTPLHIAARQSFHSIVELLLDFGASVDKRDAVGCTPLHTAVRQGLPCLAVIEMLLARGGLFDDFGDSQPVAPSADVVEKLAGSWEGSYTYLSWDAGSSEHTTLTVDFREELSSDKWHLPWFRYEDKDIPGKFLIIGYAYGLGKVRFLKLYDEVGWCYKGKLEVVVGEQDGCLCFKGKWGRNYQRWDGTLDMKKSNGPESGETV
ncbi:hypothetical protein MMC11_008333 [Xylographa trunciseda]|nr:hypothetical protein [Xylographa trunciseda]